MKKKTIRYSAFLIAAILAIGSFSIWAMNTQATVESDVSVGETPGGLDVQGNNGQIIQDATRGRPDSLEDNVDLFTVAEEENNPFEGTYEVTVYITNIDDIADEYRYLNIELEADADDGEDAEHAGYITLENGRVSFAVDSSVIEYDDTNGGQQEMSVNVAGGSFQMIEDDGTNINFLIDVSEGSTETCIFD